MQVNDIIDFKKQPRYTTPDFRATLAFNADKVGKMRSLCALISNENEFEEIILTLLVLIKVLKRKERDNSVVFSDGSTSLSISSFFSDTSSIGISDDDLHYFLYSYH